MRGHTINCRCFRFGFVVLLAAAFVVVTSPGITFGAEEPGAALTAQSDSDGEKTTPQEETQEEAPDEGEKKGFWDRFKDPEDGMLDFTASGGSGEGFFPLAVPFNEPAVGVGLVLAGAYFHPKKDSEAAESSKSMGPPTATFGAVAGTTNGTWFAAGGHHHVWKHDTIRYIGALGTGSLNLTFYGFGDQGTSEDDGLDFNMGVGTVIQQAKFRIAGKPVFVGARYTYAETDTTFDIGGSGPVNGVTDIAGLTGLVEYDSRDTVFTPNRGLRATLDVGWFSETVGGDFDYWSAKTALRYYWPLGEKWILGLRGDYDIIGDGAPFYALSFVKLRGVPAFRYLGHYVITVETELRYKIDRRWSVLGFAGGGRAATEFSNLSDADRVHSYGGGFRYLIARKLGLGAGIDIARGPEDTVVYLTIGSAW